MDSTFAVAADFATSAVGRALHTAARDAFDGALMVSGPVSARIYCFEGGIYAVDCSAFRPDYELRLRSGGRLPDLGDLAGALAAGRLTPEDLAVVHQETMLAILGRLAELPGLEVVPAPKQVTESGCTLPIPWESVVEVMRVRQARIAEDLHHVGGTASAEVSLQAIGAEPTDLPEAGALWRALGAGTDLDVAAARCAFSRAEALHLAARLVAQGHALVTSSKPRPSGGSPAVPEAVGPRPGRLGRLQA